MKFEPDDYNYIKFLLRKKQYLHALILMDSYIDNKAINCYRTYIDSLEHYNKDKSLKKEFYKLARSKPRKIGDIKRITNTFLKNIEKKLPNIINNKDYKKYKLNKLFINILKFKKKRNAVVHEIMGIRKLSVNEEFNAKYLSFFNDRYKEDRKNLLKIVDIINDHMLYWIILID